MTRDHSLLQEQLDSGMISASEARQSANRNLVTRALGVDPDVVPEVCDYGIEVGDITKLRANARNSGVYFRVVKNTLARRAVQGTQFEALAEKMVGPLVYSISADAVAAAKVVYEFAKTNDKLVIKAGAMSGSLMSAEQVAVLAATPSRDELIARLMATMNATTAKFVRTLVAIRDKNEAATAA